MPTTARHEAGTVLVRKLGPLDRPPDHPRCASAVSAPPRYAVACGQPRPRHRDEISGQDEGMVEE